MKLERISCSSSRPSMRPAPSGSTTSDIEEPHVTCVLLDERATRFDLVTHEHREDAVRGRGVFDLDADERAVRRIHGRVGEFLCVHLAEALEPAHLEAFLRELERGVAELPERVDVTPLAAERDVER